METVAQNNSAQKSAYIGVNPDSLNKIDQPEVNLTIWKRDSLGAEQAIQELLASPFEQIQFLYDRSEPLELIGAFLDEKTKLKTENAVSLWSDIMALTDKMLQVCDDQELGIGLERVNHNNCTSFHTDFLGLRLLCTYWGDATHWLENENVNRDGLGQNNNDLVVKDWSQVQTMEKNWVGLFKGENYQDNKGKGVVHRSPEILGKGNSDRLLLRIDTIKSFGKKDAE